MSLSFSLLLTSGLLVFSLGMGGCSGGDGERNTERDPAETTLIGSEKMDAPLRRALRDAGQAEDDRYDVLLGVAQETAADAEAFMTLQEDLRTAGLTIRTVSGTIVTVHGPRSAIETAAANDRISSLQLSATRSF